MDVEKVSENLESFKEFASELIERLRGDNKQDKQATLVCLSGNLGSGKTTLTQFIAEILGVTETVTSPTFVIQKKYILKDEMFDNLFHIDAYRLENGEELKKLSWEDILKDPKNLIFLEWPENVKDILPEKYLMVRLEYKEREERLIKVEEKNGG